MIEIQDMSELLTNLKADKTGADVIKAKWDTKREVWIAEKNGEPYGNEVDGKSKIVSRDIKKTEVWQHATIIDPFVSNSDMVRATPVSGEDTPLTKQSQSLLNYFFCRNFDRYGFISEAFSIQQGEGTVIARVGWTFEETETEVDVPVLNNVQIPTPQGIQTVQQIVGYKKEMQMVTTKNEPTAENRDNRTLWIDPTEKKNLKTAQFVIEHFRSSLSKLKMEGIYDNLDEIKIPSDEAVDNGTEESYEGTDDGAFKFQDDPRAELDVYEYWGNYDLNEDGIAEAIVCTWIGDTVIRLEENPYPDQEVPYVLSSIGSEPFSLFGRPNADLQSTDQKLSTSIVRSFMDTLDSSTNGQRGYKENALNPANERKFKAKKDFKYQGDNPGIWEGKYAEFNPSVTAFYEMIQKNQAELTGVRPFAGGGGNIESATRSRMAMDAVSKRETDISRNFAETFVVPILRKWLSMANEFLEPQEVERITGKPYVKPDPLDTDGNIDIRIEVATAETDAARASDISFMLQTMGQTLPFDLTKILLAEQAELKKMPGLARKIEEFEPKPDPLAQRRTELELAKLEAEVMERKSRAQENMIDMQLKKAKTKLEMAKVRDIHAGADLKDEDFVAKSTGKEHAQELEKQGQKIRGDLMKQGMNNRQTEPQQ